MSFITTRVKPLVMGIQENITSIKFFIEKLVRGKSARRSEQSGLLRGKEGTLREREAGDVRAQRRETNQDGCKVHFVRSDWGHLHR